MIICLCGKNELGKGWMPYSFFLVILKGPQNFFFGSNELFTDLLGSLVWSDRPWEKTKTNEHTSVIFLRPKITKYYVIDRACNLYIRVLYYAESDSMVFMNLDWFFWGGGGLSPFLKTRQIFSGSLLLMGNIKLNVLY